MIRVTSWAIGLLFCASAMPAFGQDDDEFVTFNTSWVPSTLCNPDVAMPVDLAELALNPRQWDGVCVAVKGFPRRNALFADPIDAERRDASWASDLKDRRVGLYGRNGLSGLRHSGGDDRTWLAVGQVGLCEDLWANYDFVSNYCHDAGSGAYIALMHDGGDEVTGEAPSRE